MGYIGLFNFIQSACNEHLWRLDFSWIFSSYEDALDLNLGGIEDIEEVGDNNKCN